MRRVAILLVAGLGLLTACSNPLGSGQPAPAAGLERTELRVGVGNPIDTAPLRMAVADGSFTRAGLRVDLVEEPTPHAGLDGLAAGKLDVAFATDVALFTAAAHGTALQLQGEAYTSAPYTMALVTLPGSDYTDLASKKAPKIVVAGENGLGALAARSMFATAGGDPTKIKFHTRSYADMPAALRDGSADAAMMPEPYITRAQQQLGARVLADSSRGATANFPVSAYAAGGLFARANQRTLATFRRVLADAQQRAADQALVRQALPSIGGIDATTAALISLGQYPTSLSGVRLQRVADLMHSTGLLANRLDVPSLLPRA
ncbi:ABC transporter substrate-binding protein [Amycolatopsis alkalitolerans]|uniref:ABC transporter substrate-binding protein n=1 Tax=Amycolatopsis alkalitolerans TaxID=2547244 RepID=A0A5C4M4W0_9PSEU|nr:ABC transporter substrate-binding protein [Amycolatopsis alkalitolerans]TNC28116.1 ABC transporter substrate-binding protein [Amycolatopsis alkalitolerans]